MTITAVRLCIWTSRLLAQFFLSKPQVSPSSSSSFFYSKVYYFKVGARHGLARRSGAAKASNRRPLRERERRDGGKMLLLFLLLVASVDEWPPRRWALRQFMFVVCVSPTRNATLLLLAITNAHHLFLLPLNFCPFFKPTSWPLLERTKYNEIIARLKLKRFYCDIGRFPIRGKRGGTVGRRHLLILTYLEPLVIRMKKKRKKKKWIARSRRKLISTRLCIYAQSQLWWWWWWILASCRRYEKEAADEEGEEGVECDPIRCRRILRSSQLCWAHRWSDDRTPFGR